MPFSNPDDDYLRSLLERAKRIAVVGLSPKAWRDSHHIGEYLLGRGYDVIPVYPRLDAILGQKVYRKVADIPGGVDLVDVFRRSSELPGVVDDVLAAGAPAVWFQLGCVHEPAAARAQAAGTTVVMDLCILVEHRRLLGPDWSRAS